MKQYLAGTLAVLLVISIIANFLLYMRYSTSRPLVIVGNQVITKKDYQNQLELESGKLILNKMVYTTLILQAAKKANILPSDADVTQRINELVRRTPKVVPNDPGKLMSFKDSLKAELALENLRTQGISVSDADVVNCYHKYQKQFALPAQVGTSLVVTQNAQDAATAAADLKQDLPEDVIARQPRMNVAGVNGYTVNMDALPIPIKQRIYSVVFHMKPGEVKTMQLDQNYLTFKIKKSESSNIPPLNSIRDQVVRFAKLDKAPSAAFEIATLYQAAKPQFAADRYQELYFQEVQNANLKSLSSDKQ